MRRFVISVVLALPLLLGASIPVNVPNAPVFITMSREQCEIIRVEERIRDSAAGGNWGDKECIEFIFHREIIAAIRAKIQNDVVQQARQDASDEVVLFEVSFPFYVAVAGRPDPPVQMRCGDGIADNDLAAGYVEDCDVGDGTPQESATCNASCTTSACGDGELNVTAGEQCDDGNTTPGDDCDASCLVE